MIDVYSSDDLKYYNENYIVLNINSIYYIYKKNSDVIYKYESGDIIKIDDPVRPTYLSMQDFEIWHNDYYESHSVFDIHHFRQLLLIQGKSATRNQVRELIENSV